MSVKKVQRAPVPMWAALALLMLYLAFVSTGFGHGPSALLRITMSPWTLLAIVGDWSHGGPKYAILELAPWIGMCGALVMSPALCAWAGSPPFRTRRRLRGALVAHWVTLPVAFVREDAFYRFQQAAVVVLPWLLCYFALQIHLFRAAFRRIDS